MQNKTINLHLTINITIKEPNITEFDISDTSTIETTQEPQTTSQNDYDVVTFSGLYEQLLSKQDRDNRVSIKTIKANHSSLNRFEKWCVEKFSVQFGHCVSLLNQPNILKDYAEYLRSQPKGNSASMCCKALATIIKLSTACMKNKMIISRPDGVRKSHINILRPRTEKQRRIKAVPVTINELQQMLSVVDGCKWPRIGKVSPAVFWKTCLLSHYVYGFRSQDWFAIRTSEKLGLLWSGVVDDIKCPKNFLEF